MAEDEPIKQKPDEAPPEADIDERRETRVRVPDRRASGGQTSRGPARYLRDGDNPVALAGRVITSRFRSLRERFNRDFMQRTLHIGVSARIFHPEAGSKGLFSKNLQYLEESIAQWVMSRDVLVFMKIGRAHV